MCMVLHLTKICQEPFSYNRRFRQLTDEAFPLPTHCQCNQDQERSLIKANDKGLAHKQTVHITKLEAQIQLLHRKNVTPRENTQHKCFNCQRPGHLFYDCMHKQSQPGQPSPPRTNWFPTGAQKYVSHYQAFFLLHSLDNLLDWGNDLQKLFNLIKCKFLHVGIGNPNFKYSTGVVSLEVVKEEKD